jgi:hypothetical protein
MSGGHEDDWDEHGDFAEDMDDEEDECGLGDDGQCALAGTEHCDFSCMWRDSELFAGNKAWRKNHRRKKRAPQLFEDDKP